MDTMGPLTRREWLAGTLTLLTAGCASRRIQDRADEIETVNGPLAAARLGVTLMHEHVLVDFIGAAQVSPSRYDADAVFTAVLPHLQQVRRLGCETLVECTPAYLGRDPRLLRRLSVASGLNILSNTGYYGAANDKHLPEHAFHETAEQIAGRWVREYEGGIEGTGIKPALMKIGVDGSPLSAVDAKLVAAAALAHHRTGLAIASHTLRTSSMGRFSWKRSDMLLTKTVRGLLHRDGSSRASGTSTIFPFQRPSSPITSM